MRRRGPAVGALVALAATIVMSRALPTRAAEDGRRTVFAKAVALAERGDLSAARRLFRQLVQIYPALEDYHLAHLVAVNERIGRYRDARADADRLLRHHPKSVWYPIVLARRARLAAALGEPQARDLAVRALAHPHAGDDARAIALVVRARQQAAEDPAVAYATYQEVRRLGGDDAATARTEAEALEEAHPALLEDPALLLAEGKLLVDEQRLERAVTRLRSVTARGSPRGRSEAHRALARIHARRGALEQAAAAYEAAAAADPETAGRAHYELAMLWWNRDHDAQARAILERLLAEQATHVEPSNVHYTLGRIADGAGRHTDARRHYERARDAGEPASIVREARWRIAWTWYRAGELAAAATAFDDLARHDPDSTAAARYWEGRVRERQGDRGAAAAAFRAVLEAEPEGYYAMLSERRLGTTAPRPSPPAPLATVSSVPERHAYHWTRSRELHAAGLDDAATRELDALARELPAGSEVTPRLLPAYTEVGAFGRAVRLARSLEAKNALAPAAAAAYTHPRAYWDLVTSVARTHAIDPYLVLATIRQESLFDPRAVSPANAYGLMQLILPTAEQVAGSAVSPADLFDGTLNVRLGTRHLHALLDRYDGDVPRALAAYNAGVDAVAKWNARAPDVDLDEFVERISFRETRAYVKAVLGHQRRYRRLYVDADPVPAPAPATSPSPRATPAAGGASTET